MTDTAKQDYFDKPDNWFDNSKIDDYNRCHAAFMWKWIFGIKGKSPNIHLIFGNAMHDALAHYNKNMMSEESFVADTNKSDSLRIMSDMMVNAPEHRTKNSVIGEKLFNLTLVELTQNPILQGKITGVEMEASKKLDSNLHSNNDLIYFGKIDLKIRNNKGKTIIIDYKTKGRLASSYINAMILSRQLKGYLWLNDTNIQGVMILHVIQKPEVQFYSYYIDNDNLERWRKDTVQICTDIYNKVRLARNIELSHLSLYELFPRLGLKCQDWGCEHMRLCEQNCPAEDIWIDDNIYAIG